MLALQQTQKHKKFQYPQIARVPTCAQVTYPMAVATMIHLAPLVLIMLVLTTMTKGTGQTLSKLLPIGKQAGLSVASFLCAVTIPAVTGALRSGLSGEICCCLHSCLISSQLAVHPCCDGRAQVRLVR